MNTKKFQVFHLDKPLNTFAWQVFSLAMMTLFHVTAGGLWPEEPALYEEDGTVNWRVGLFQIGYEISVGWVILQVKVDPTVALHLLWTKPYCMCAAGECGCAARQLHQRIVPDGIG
jgi:hypothetical protein